MINLLPPEIKQNTRYAIYNRSLLKVCLYLGAVILLVGSVYGFGYLLLNQRLEKSNLELANKNSLLVSDKTEAEAQKLSDNINTTLTLLKRERRFSVIFKQIGSVLPANSCLSALALSNDPKLPLEINAVVKDENQALVLKRNLEEKLDTDGTKLFVGADIQSIEQPKDNSTSQCGGSVKGGYTTRITTGFNDKGAKPAANAATPASGAKP